MSTTLEENSTLIGEAQALAETLPDAGSGTDISLGLTGASVGDIIKVKAVDASGKPTAWEAAGLPSGDNWELLNEFSISENALTVMINQDSSGNTFTLKKMRMIMYLPQITNTSGEIVQTGYANYQINGICPSSYLYPSNDWSNGEFWWDIEVMDNVLYVKCRKSNGGGGLRPTSTTAFHYSNSVQSKYEGGITSFLWTIFSPNENKPSAMAGATFKVWGVRI